jgi:hypothetical protein
MNRHVGVTAVIFLVFAAMAALALWRGDWLQAGLFGVGTVAFLVRLATMRRGAAPR